MIDIVSMLNDAEAWQDTQVVYRGELLVEAGNLCHDLFFIETGCLRVFTRLEGREQSIRFAYPGNFVTALDSYINEKPSIYSIEALKQSTVKIISKSRFDHIINSKPEYIQVWYQLLEMMILGMMERELDLLTNSPSLRYQNVLARSPQLFQEVPHKYIADYLRMAPETLSRLKKS